MANDTIRLIKHIKDHNNSAIHDKTRQLEDESGAKDSSDFRPFRPD